MKRLLFNLMLVFATISMSAFNTMRVTTTNGNVIDFDLSDVSSVYTDYLDFDPDAPLILIVEDLLNGTTTNYTFTRDADPEDAIYYCVPSFSVEFEAPSKTFIKMWLKDHKGRRYGIQTDNYARPITMESYSATFRPENYEDNNPYTYIDGLQYAAWGGKYKCNAVLFGNEYKHNMSFLLNIETSPRPDDSPYFSKRDPRDFSVEGTDKIISIPLYRQFTYSEQTVEIVATYSDDAAKYISVPSSITFAPEISVAWIDVAINAEAMEQNKTYSFNLKIDDFFIYNNYYDGEGEATFTVTCTDWIDIPNCQIYDDVLFSPFGSKIEIWDVEMQKHPTENIYRIKTPYASGPYSYIFNENLANKYLYIAVDDQNNAYFCDKIGTPTPWYNTGCYCSKDTNFGEEYGSINLGCYYSAYLNEEPLYFRDAGGYPWDPNWVNYAGKFNEQPTPNLLPCGTISFSGSLAVMLDNIPYYGDLASRSRSLRIGINGANANSWQNIGMATYTDGFVGQFLTLINEGNSAIPTLTYQVPVEQNVDNPSLYRLVNPYSIKYWEYGYDRDKDLYMTIDATDPNMVIVIGLDILPGNTSNDNISVLNAAAYYMNYAGFTAEQIIAEGFNDIIMGNDITINHPLTFKGGTGEILWYIDNFVPAKIVLPQVIERAPQRSAEPLKLQLPKEHKSPISKDALAKRNDVASKLMKVDNSQLESTDRHAATSQTIKPFRK